jgi:hypothetical protein
MTRWPLYGRLGGPQDRSRRVWKISPSSVFDPQTVLPVASRYIDWAVPPCVVYYKLLVRTSVIRPSLTYTDNCLKVITFMDSVWWWYYDYYYHMNQLKQTLHVNFRTYVAVKFYSTLYVRFMFGRICIESHWHRRVQHRLGRLYYAASGHIFRLYIIQITQ